MVLIRSTGPEGLFNTHTLSLIVDLTEAFRQIEGIHPWNVFSLATEKGDRVIPGTLSFRAFLTPLPQTHEDLEQLRDDLRAIQLYTGTLVSYDETATSIMIGVPPGMDRTALYRTIWGIIEARGAERFGLVARALEPGPLKKFYQSIARSEERHYALFLELANLYLDGSAVASRWRELLEVEAGIAAGLPLRAALH